ncbi:glycoside hydrolase family 9 protein [Nibricoccus sp. IMCC34717]|uniref:glycoside hydrolase family 9 protein n=1 Tax=Nibricoccus sp. IMCC34717 TaxID=3034021 RepID=UPI00384D68A0
MTPRFLLGAAALLSATVCARASSVVEFSALHESLLVVHFDDGYAVHHRHGQTRYENERVIAKPLDTVAADTPAAWRLFAADGRPLEIASVARKSKPTEIALRQDDKGHVLEHWVYLRLKQPLREGDGVVLQTTLADNGAHFTFDFVPARMRSEAVHVNQVGYPTEAYQKIGYISHWAGSGGAIDFSGFEGREFHLIEVNSGRISYTGRVAHSRALEPVVEKAGGAELRLNDTGAATWECDFSNFAPTRPGEFRLAVDGIGSSYSFQIAPDALRPAFVAMLRGFYHQRSGIELKAEFTNLPHPAAAHPLKTPGFRDRMKYTARRGCDYVYTEDQREAPALLAEMKGPILTYGFYQDAGDWDGYIAHLRVPALLLTTYEISPSHFADSEARIPESGNGVPDIVDEGAWLLRYLHRTRHAILNTVDANGKPFGTGGAAGTRVAGDFFGFDEKDGKSIPSWEDNHRDYVVSGEDPFASCYYAGLSAQMAYILKGLGRSPANDDWKTQAYDESYDWTKIDWLREARETYAWALANTRAGDEQKGLALYRFYAASALYRLTGEQAYADQIAKDLATLGRIDGLGAIFARPFLSLPLATQDKLGGAKIRAGLIAWARTLTTDSASRRAFRFGGPLAYPVQVGQSSSPMVEETLAVYALTRDPAMRAAIGTTADYVLGGNPLNLCWPTRVGKRSPLGLFNMNYWTTSLVHEEKPGLLSGFIRDGVPEGIIPYGCTAPGLSWIKGETPYSANWPDKWTYPQVEEWPQHELWYDQWCSPPSAEYTVHQTMIAAASVFGLLCGDHPNAPAFTPPEVP